MLQCGEDKPPPITGQARDLAGIRTVGLAAINGAGGGDVGIADGTFDHLFSLARIRATAGCLGRGFLFSATRPVGGIDGAIVLHPVEPFEALPDDDDGGNGEQQLCE